MQLGDVHHVSIIVGDVEEAGRFYRNVLGLEQIPRPDFGVPGLWLRADRVQVHLVEVADHVAPDGQHFALAVDDLDGAIEELTSGGITVSEPIELPGAGRQAFLHDPSGNMIELNQPV